MATPRQVYPFATVDGKPIPLDIIKPSGLQIISVDDATGGSLVAPAEMIDPGLVVVFMASDLCLVKIGDATPPSAASFAAGALVEDCIIVPKNTLVTTWIKAETAALGARAILGTVTLYVQYIERWAGLALPLQYRKG